MYVVVFRMICLTSVLKTCNKLNDWNTMYCINIFFTKEYKKIYIYFYIIYKNVHGRMIASSETFYIFVFFFSCIKEIECSSPLISSFFITYIFTTCIHMKQHICINNFIQRKIIRVLHRKILYFVYVFFLILWTKYDKQKNFVLKKQEEMETFLYSKATNTSFFCKGNFLLMLLLY